MTRITHRLRAVGLSATLVLGGTSAALVSAGPAHADAATCQSDLLLAEQTNNYAYHADLDGDSEAALLQNTDTGAELVQAETDCLDAAAGVTAPVADAEADNADSVADNTAGDTTDAEFGESDVYEDVQAALDILLGGSSCQDTLDLAEDANSNAYYDDLLGNPTEAAAENADTATFLTTALTDCLGQPLDVTTSITTAQTYVADAAAANAVGDTDSAEAAQVNVYTYIQAAVTDAG